MVDKTEPLTVKSEEASKLLGVCPKTLWTLTKNGVIPCLKIGKSVRYSRETVSYTHLTLPTIYSV